MATILTYVVWIAAAVIFMAFVGADWLSDSTTAAVQDQGLVGEEAFFMDNMLLWIGIAALVFIVVLFAAGGDA